MSELGSKSVEIDQFLKGRLLKQFAWFFLANGAVVVSLAIVSGGALLPLAPFLLILGFISPVFGLMLSKSFAKRAHRIRTLTAESAKTQQERFLVETISALSNKANLKKTPEIGVYSSQEINAFATGMTKNSALIAFSDSLLNTMGKDDIAAVAAHEIAHIVNGDMQILTIVQSVVNAVVLLVTIPLSVFKLGALFSKDIGVFTYWIISLVKVLVTIVCVFLGNILVMFFSRQREFKADLLASYLIGPKTMISALSALENQPVSSDKKQLAYAALKISAAPAFLDIFSTHPSIKRRIARLQVKHELNVAEGE